MKVDNFQFYDYLLSNDVVSEEVVKPLLTEAQKNNIQLYELLTREEIFDKKEVLKMQSEMLGFQFMDLSKPDILADTLHIIPEHLAKRALMIAFKKEEDKLYVAMANPEDLQMIDFLHKKTGLEIIVHVADPQEIRAALRLYEKTLNAEFGDIFGKLDDDEKDLAEMAEDLPIVRIVHTLVKHAILQGASDIHIEPLEKSIVVRFRIDGILRQAMSLPKNVLPGIVARVKVLANLKLDEHRLPQDGRFKIETDEYKVSFRVSVLPVFDGEKIVMRLLDEQSGGLTLEKIGIHPNLLEMIDREIHKPNGMILVTGPTGSGKTTTLYAVLEILNSPEVNISTVEDPVEYRMQNINQTQVYAKIGMTFAAALRALLRQDPDVIMVGEIRDHETLEIAIHAAMTGHLVLSTLHTNSAAGAVPRMVDMGSEPFLIASTTNIIVGQRLVRRLCFECRETYKINEKELETLRESYDMEKIFGAVERMGGFKAGEKSWLDVSLSRAMGCSSCNNTGYKGRAGIYEVFIVTEDIEKLITEKGTADDLEQKARQEGMFTMADDGFYKSALGLTTVEEVLRVTKE